MKTLATLIALLLPTLSWSAQLPRGVREISATSCDVIRLNVALGMTTLIMFDETPTLTLHADDEHFKIRTNSNAKRSIAIIPYVEKNIVNELFPISKSSEVYISSENVLAAKLDQAFKTNLFVFFKDNNQLMFELRFVPKQKADNILHVGQIFRKDCQL